MGEMADYTNECGDEAWASHTGFVVGGALVTILWIISKEPSR